MNAKKIPANPFAALMPKEEGNTAAYDSALAKAMSQSLEELYDALATPARSNAGREAGVAKQVRTKAIYKALQQKVSDAIHEAEETHYNVLKEAALPDLEARMQALHSRLPAHNENRLTPYADILSVPQEFRDKDKRNHVIGALAEEGAWLRRMSEEHLKRFKGMNMAELESAHKENERRWEEPRQPSVLFAHYEARAESDALQIALREAKKHHAERLAVASEKAVNGLLTRLEAHGIERDGTTARLIQGHMKNGNARLNGDEAEMVNVSTLLRKIGPAKAATVRDALAESGLISTQQAAALPAELFQPRHSTDTEPKGWAAGSNVNLPGDIIEGILARDENTPGNDGASSPGKWKNRTAKKTPPQR